MDKFSALSDHDLLELTKMGDQAAFSLIYNRYSGVLIVHALNILGDEDDARDAIQEVFIHFWNRRECITVTCNLKPYLYAAVRNSVLNKLKKEKHIAKMLEGFKAESLRLKKETQEEDPDVILLQRIEGEIQRLPEKMREVFLLSRRGDLTYEQISSVLNVAPNTVRKQVSNALRILRVNLRSLLMNFF
ncbi:RNA polymerase sigma-70 factor (ECF subfamily) [Pedobacter africanus]|uniref:RNA polymerase sigma factor n=1 Tax=Pedobacter africanus TaxID=151894 RepID=UPI00339102D5